MIKIENLVKFYGEYQALKGISCTINKGEIVGFLGPNGAGKSTMMRIITGYLPATSGYVHLDEFEVYENPIEVKRRIGYTPENVSLYNEMSVSEYLKFCSMLKGIKNKDRKKRIDETIQLTGLTEYRNRLIGHLSKGYKQRTGIAQAILSDPDVLILDEPTSGLDPNQLIDIRALIKNLAGKRTVILSTHILSEVEEMCERALIIDQGVLIAEDTIEGLKVAMDKEILGANIELKVDGKREKEALQAIREVEGVVQAYEGTRGNIIVEGERGLDIRPIIARHIINKGFNLVELKSLERSLEDVFIYFTDKKKNENKDQE